MNSLKLSKDWYKHHIKLENSLINGDIAAVKTTFDPNTGEIVHEYLTYDEYYKDTTNE